MRHVLQGVRYLAAGFAGLVVQSWFAPGLLAGVAGLFAFALAAVILDAWFVGGEKVRREDRLARSKAATAEWLARHPRFPRSR